MKMIDALYPNSIPQGTSCDIIAAYIDHSANPESFNQAVTRFPNAKHLKISVRGTVGADVLDYERSTVIGKQNPSACVTWVLSSRAHGIDPTIYCNQLDPEKGWPAIRKAFQDAKVREPHWWVAKYDGDPTIPPGASAKQFTDLDQNGKNTYDTSSTITGWLTSEDDMFTDADRDLLNRVGAVLHQNTDGLSSKIDSAVHTIVGDQPVTLTRIGDVLHANTDNLKSQLKAIEPQLVSDVKSIVAAGGDPAAVAQAVFDKFASVFEAPTS